MRNFIIGVLYFLMSCDQPEIISFEELDPETCDSPLVDNGKYYELNNNAYLWGGEDTSTHFNVSNWTLNVCYIKKGLGREKFHALNNPDYELLKDTEVNYPDSTQAVIVKSNSDVFIYPYQILRRHEVVNETMDGEPIVIVYCFLADLASTYTRRYCGDVLTFGVTGYTYQNPSINGGKESFILWDRNSESLWWPINDKSVAGDFEGAKLEKHKFSKWGTATFEDIRRRHPDAYVLKNSQPRKGNGQIRRSNGC